MVSYRALGVVFLVLLLVGTVSADVLTVYTSDTEDGIFANTTNGSFTMKQAGLTDTFWANGDHPSPAIYANTTANNYSSFRWSGYSFNTSPVPDSAIIDSVILTLGISDKYTQLGSPALSIIQFSPANPAVLQASDGNTRTTLRYATDIPNAAVPTYNRINITLNADGISATNKTGYTSLMTSLSWFVDNSTTGLGWSSGAYTRFNIKDSSNSNATYRPFITVTYHLSDTTPPGTIQGLSNDTTTCEQITWGWQSPADADFNHTMVYRNGTFLYNLSNTTYSDTWAGLTFGVDYTFSSHTVDITGNVDPDWVNMTATPTTCDIIPVANFTANETEVCVGDLVLFNDTSTNSPTYWNWIFTGGWDSHYQNFTHAFDAAGSYNVSLEAGNDAGSDTEIKYYYINVTDCTGNPDFSANVTCQIGAPLPVQFTGFCPDPTYKNHWDFGDGNTTDDAQSPEYIYNFTGSFTVSHSCKYGGQATVFENKTNYIIVGVNGTYCTSTTSGTGVSGDVYEDEPGFPVLFILCGVFGSLLLFGIIGRSL